MPGKHRSHEQILEDRARITELHKLGWSNQDIAEEVNLPEYTVCRDLAAVRAVLYEQAIENLDEARKLELAKINLIEAEAWEQWERSKQPRIIQSSTSGETVNKKSIKKEERGGDPRYLATIQWCSEQRAKLLGLVVNRLDMTTGGKPMHTVQLVEVKSASEREQSQTLLH